MQRAQRLDILQSQYLFFGMAGLAALIGFLLEFDPFAGPPRRPRWPELVPALVCAILSYTASPLGVYRWPLGPYPSTWVAAVSSLTAGVLLAKAVAE